MKMIKRKRKGNISYITDIFRALVSMAQASFTSLVGWLKAPSILRQLIDAGTLSNLPAGLKARGLRIKGDDSPLMPGEFRDVDVPGGAIRDAITFIPYKEPSSVLYQLLGNIVDEGRRLAPLRIYKLETSTRKRQ